MNILKKTDMGDSKKNYFHDTRPDIPTYDLDTLVNKGNALRKVANVKPTYEFEGVTYMDYSSYKEARIEHFCQNFPPFFTRVEYPLSVTVLEDDGEEVKLCWNREWLRENMQSDIWHYFIRTMERNIVNWYTNGSMEGDFLENLDAALKILKDGHKVK